MPQAPDRRGGWIPRASRLTWWQRMWEPFWVLPLAVAFASIVLGLVLPLVDEATWHGLPMLFHGGPDGARSVLTTIASAMISVTGLVFSITMVVLQLASSQFTPRVLGSFLDSRVTQATLGVFVGTFLYALTVLRSVRGASDGIEKFVPQLATSVAFVGVVASVGFFLAFINHITTSIQVQEVLARTSAATVKTLDRMIPPDQEDTAVRGQPPLWTPGPEQLSSDVVLHDGADRYITDISYRHLVDLAEAQDIVVSLDRQVGEYIVAGERVAQIWRSADSPEPDESLLNEIRSCIASGRDRSLRQDVAFGIRQMVDVAERALSPGVNDPTTAAQAINALHSVLRRAVQRPVPSRFATDGSGTVRLAYRPQTVEQLLELGVTEIAHWGRSSVRVPDQLRHLMDDLASVCLPQHVDVIARLRDQVNAWEKQS